jgi:hypothetical protein
MSYTRLRENIMQFPYRPLVGPLGPLEEALIQEGWEGDHYLGEPYVPEGVLEERPSYIRALVQRGRKAVEGMASHLQKAWNYVSQGYGNCEDDPAVNAYLAYFAHGVEGRDATSIDSYLLPLRDKEEQLDGQEY